MCIAACLLWYRDFRVQLYLGSKSTASACACACAKPMPPVLTYAQVVISGRRGSQEAEALITAAHSVPAPDKVAL